jgi:MFS superfamily sulfate permease-like transporter
MEAGVHARPDRSRAGVIRDRLTRARAEVCGGLVSATIAIPLAMGYGMFAFVPLGDAYFAHGVRAGLYTAIAVALVNVATGDRSVTVYAPRVVTTFFLVSLVASLAHSGAVVRSGRVELTLALAFLIIFLGGVFQVLFGVMRLGTLLQHTPHPVLAGFQNAAALLLFLVQIGTVLGYDGHVPLGRLASHLGAARPLSVLVAAVTVVAVWQARRITARVPPLIVGLGVGTAAYYAVVAVGFGDRLGPLIGATTSAPDDPSTVAAVVDAVRDPVTMEMLPLILTGALGLAIIASIDALLCAQLLWLPGVRRPETNLQLRRLGLGNMVAASCGGITGGVNLGSSLANRAYGGRTAVSVLVNAGAVLLTLALCMPAIGYLPRVVLSGVIMVVAVQHVDPSTVQLVRRLAAGPVGDRRAATFDLAVIALVATLSIVVNIVAAVLVGLGLAMVLFLLRMSRSPLRRTYGADAVPSRRERDAVERELLGREGRKVHVLELEGPLFFGTAERLAAAIESAVEQGARFVIVDLGRVTDVDSTGARLLLQTHQDLAVRGVHLLLSAFERRLGSYDLSPLGDRLFPDADRAVEWAEDRVVAAGGRDRPEGAEFPIEHLHLFRGLKPEELALVRETLERRCYEAGDVVIRQGSEESELLMIALGSASVYLHRADGETTRLVTFSAGTIVGELAFLDRRPRSATVVADAPLVCYVLTGDGFDRLQAHEPATALRIITNLAGEIGTRLRRATQTLSHVIG